MTILWFFILDTSYKCHKMILVLISTIFILMSCSVLITRLFKPLQAFLTYGKTNSKPSSNNSCISQSSQSNPTLFQTLATSWQVPKSWFSYFYILSTFLSFWVLLSQYTRTGGLYLSSTLLFVHSVRRCYETLFIMNQNPFKRRGSMSVDNGGKVKEPMMQLPHFLVGLVFYSCVNMTQYALTVPMATNPVSTKGNTSLLLGTALFVIGSLIQTVSHSHLSSLPKYSLPNYPSRIRSSATGFSLVPYTHYLFKYVACPHYTSELMIYLGLAILSPSPTLAPTLALPFLEPLNDWQPLAAHTTTLFWILTNLAISAEQSLLWYRKGLKSGIFDKTREKVGNEKNKRQEDERRLEVPKYAILPGLL